MTCPHCTHVWAAHTPRCTECGCYWMPPGMEPGQPVPLTVRQQIVQRVKDAIYAELDRQHEESEIDGAGYWDSDWGRLDGEPDWTQVAAAALSVIADDEPDDTMYAFMTEVGWW